MTANLLSAITEAIRNISFIKQMIVISLIIWTALLYLSRNWDTSLVFLLKKVCSITNS